MDAVHVGVEIGGTKLQCVCGGEDGRVDERWSAGVDVSRGARGVLEQISAWLKEIAGQWRVAAVGVGFGGPVHWRSGEVARSHHVGGWDGFPLGRWLAEQTGAPAFVENDANVAALAEAQLGAGAGLDPVFYTTLGSGVGGGLVAGGEIYHGIPPGEAEFGHVRLDRGGTTVEGRCSGWAIDRRVREAAATQPDGVLAGLLGGRRGGEAAHLGEALRLGDAAAARILAELADDLAYGLSHVVHLFHPAVMVIGGGLSLLGEALRRAVEERLASYVMEAFRPPPPVRLSQLGRDVVPVGALLLAGRRRGGE